MYDQLIGLPNYYTTAYFWVTTLVSIAGFAVLFYGQEFGWKNWLEDTRHKLRQGSCQCGFHRYQRSLKRG